MTKFYVNGAGVYIGGFDGAQPPAGATEVATPPSNGADKWINGAWIAAVIVPQSITMCQARLALLAASLIASVNSAIANLTGPTAAAAQTQWEYSTLVHRNDVLVLSMAAALGLTSAQLDALFIAGALL